VIEAEEHGQALNEPEIAGLWRAASGIGGPFGGLVKMGLLTGLRRGELAAMSWDWIDRQGLRITVPGRVMKNGREHVVPITNMIAKLLDETPDRGGGLVFPSEKRLGGATPMSGWSKLMTRLRQVSGVNGVGLHDLRRTYRSALADLGVREEIAEAMIAHRRSGLVARYNRAELWDQRREVAEKLDAWLAKIVTRTDGPEAGNAVPLGAVKRATAK
jgi:integrase